VSGDGCEPLADLACSRDVVESNCWALSPPRLSSSCSLVRACCSWLAERWPAGAVSPCSGARTIWSTALRCRFVTQGFTVGATNPKTVVFLTAILPQFVSRPAGNVPTQILLLGLLFGAIAVASGTMWALAAAALRAWFARSPRRLEPVGAPGGLGIAAVGLGFLGSGRKGYPPVGRPTRRTPG
jgi:hypothetical protein